jgi:RND family efflux transporter MFP subunit
MAKENLERMKQLYELGAISKLELEQAEVQASDSVLLSVEGQMAQAKAQYDAAAKAYNDLDVKAPVDGIVTSLNVRIGDMATNASSAATVVDMEKVYVNVSVSEKMINHIKSGQEVLVEIGAAGKTVKGKIDSLSLAADAMTGKYGLKVYIDNEDGQIKPGMFAKVTVPPQPEMIPSLFRPAALYFITAGM